jgi:predicted amidophosphoribosyltransferase
LVKEAEKKSSRICENCGKDTAFTSGKICVVTLCPDCKKEFLKDPLKNLNFNWIWK